MSILKARLQHSSSSKAKLETDIEKQNSKTVTANGLRLPEQSVSMKMHAGATSGHRQRT
jgi:hypothetical protein